MQVSTGIVRRGPHHPEVGNSTLWAKLQLGVLTWYRRLGLRAQSALWPRLRTSDLRWHRVDLTKSRRRWQERDKTLHKFGTATDEAALVANALYHPPPDHSRICETRTLGVGGCRRRAIGFKRLSAAGTAESRVARFR